MNVLLTGATGFVGKHLHRSLSCRDDVEVTVLSRRTENHFPKYVTVSGIDGECDFSDALFGKDVVVHCAARVHVMNDVSTNASDVYREVNTLGTINLATQAANAGVSRFIFISSVKVNGESTEPGRPFNAFDEREPKDNYALSKAEAEVGLLKIAQRTGMEVVIIRPPLVYGAGVKANFASFMRLVHKGLPLPFGSIQNNRRSMVSIDNLVDLVVTCIEHPKAANQVFLVSDDNDVSTAELVKLMAESLGVRPLLVPFPMQGYKLLGAVTRTSDIIERLTGTLQVDITHTKNTLSWKPPQSLEEALQQVAATFKD